MKTLSVVVVGGGFAGAAIAVHMRRMAGSEVSITVVEPRETIGAGLAYGTKDPAHRINVPSDAMTVLADEPRAFTNWLERTDKRRTDPAGEDGSGAHYSRRRDFGAFMADLAAGKVVGLRGGVEHVRDRAVSLQPAQHGCILTLAGGRKVQADRVVLATSHDRPALPFQAPPEITAHKGYLANPWDTDSLACVGSDARVVVLGTGLTMVDVVSGLLERGHKGPILALSRRGLLPNGHGAFSPVVAVPEHEHPSTALAALGLARRLARTEQAEGRDWQLAVDGLRRSAATIWYGLTTKEQAKALRRLRPFWDVHRYRIAPQLAARIHSARSRGHLEVRAAGVVGLSAKESKIFVTMRARSGPTETIACDAVVNCLGPCADVTRRDDPLLQELFASGHARPDPHRLGLDVDGAFRVLDRAARPIPTVRAVGPLTRGAFWEVVGVPELSDQCRRLAETLVSEIAMADIQPATP